MIAKITQGNKFNGSIQYLFKKKSAKEVARHLLEKTQVQEIIDEFNFVQKKQASIKKPIKKPVWHCSLSLPKEEKITDDAWESIVKDFVKKMEIPFDHQYIAVKHQDTQHEHIHLVVNRISSIDFKVWGARFCVFKAIRATRELEQEHNLTPVKTTRKTQRIKIKNGEFRMKQRTGISSDKEIIKEKIDEVEQEIKEQAKKNISILEFQYLLEKKNVLAKANIAKNGKMSGFSFALKGKDNPIKGSHISKRYGWQSLQTRQIIYYVNPVETTNEIVSEKTKYTPFQEQNKK